MGNRKKFHQLFGNVRQNELSLHLIEPTTLPVGSAHPGGSSIFREESSYEI